MMGRLMPYRGLLGASDAAITIMGSTMKNQRHVDGGVTQASFGFWSNPARVIATVLLTGAMVGLAGSAAPATPPPPTAESPRKSRKNDEVITGGASSTYGSDAIAGVLSFKLRDHFSGAEVSYQHGETTHGDGATEHASALLGGNFADDRGNAVLAIEYSERGVVHGADRPFFANIRQLARPPEGILPAGTFGPSPTIGAVNGGPARYPGPTPVARSGAHHGS